MMKNILVTGGAGFIGSNFVRYWVKNNPEDRIVIVDSLTYAGNLENLLGVPDDNLIFEPVSINETEKLTALLVENKCSLVVNFAAESHVDRSIEAPDIFLETNVMGTHNLLKAARTAWGKLNMEGHFHHVSTDEVYGDLEASDPAFTESTPYAPNSPYSASKASSDFLVRAYHHTYGMRTTTSNCSNNYGPYHFPEKLIPLTILKILHGEAIPVYGTGENVRDWLYVDDHARGIELIINRGVSGETYNVGGENEWKNIDIVKLIAKLIDQRFSVNAQLKARFKKCPASEGRQSESLIEFVEDRAGHDFRYAIDTLKISTQLDFKPAIEFEQGIELTVDWYLENTDWWESVQSGAYMNKRSL